MKVKVRKWLLSLALVPSVLMAETREVSNAVDLVKALTELNGNTANVIKLAPGNYDVSAYEMYAGEGSAGSYTKMPAHLMLNKASVIGQSDNPRDTVIYGNLTKVIFKTEGGVLRNLTVSNGYCSAGGSYGAGLSGAGSGTYGGAACSNLVLTCNDCSASNGGGGAGMGTCYDCECCYNKAVHGAGAAYVTKATRFYIHDNVATTTGGGALNGSYYDSVIVNNQADHFAGYSANLPFTCWNTTIVSNTAKYAAGAGALTTGQRETFVNCTFAFNKATSTYGGAGEKLSLTNCLVYGNRATTYGGGVVNSEVSGGVISNNLATTAGGGTYEARLDGVKVVCNVLDNLTPGPNYYGAGVYGGTATNCLIAFNRSSNAGGGAAKATLVDCVVSNNFAMTYGGGVLMGVGTDCDIVFNMVSNDYKAAGLTASDYWAFGAGAREGVFTNCLFAGNAIPPCNSEQQMGGAANGSTLVGCRVFNNYAKVGAAFNGGIIRDSVISNNAAASSQYVIRSMTSLTGCDIYGAMFDAPGAMMNCVVRAGGFGATLAPGENVYATGTFGVSHSSPLVVNSQSQAINATNCLFTGCQVSSMIAGSNARRRHMSLVNCTFAGNQANCTFDNMRADTDDTKGELEIVNCLFAENLSSAGTESRDFRPDSAANDTSVTIRNCLIPGGLPAGWTPRETGVIVTGSPRFCKDHDLANPYALRYASPARAAGLVQDWMSAATDIRCNADFARLRDDKVDIGCYQCWLDPVGSMLLVR